MNPRQSPLGPGVILILALLAGGWFLQRGVAQDQNVYVQARLLQEVVDHIADRFVDPVDRATLYDSAIDGMLRGLNDPNSTLLEAEAYENFRIQTEGDYGGVGLEIVDRDDFITVVSPLPGTPGFRAGIRAGDEIVEVEGESTRGWSAQEAVRVLRGRPGTDASVRVRRPGVEELIEFTLTRERIQIHSVPFASLMDERVAYVPLGLFSETSTREVRAAIDSLAAEGASAVVLDLRGNPGGVLDQGVGIADLFLERGAAVAEIRGQGDEPERRFQAAAADQLEGLPVVVLVDQRSASAAEIVAGALQDHDRALVIGVPTFGKGSVQTLFSLTGGNVLKLTTARWYTPRGRSIERVGEWAEGEEDERAVTLTVDGEYVAIPDTVGRPVVTSYGGRSLFGGGGIVPDLMVLSDTLSTAEQRAVRTLYRQAGAVNTAMFNFAVEYLQNTEVDSPDFQLSSADMARFHERLRSKGIQVDDDVREGADRYLRRQLGAQIALQAGGDRFRFLRYAPDDAALQRALELLRDARDPADLFARVGGVPAEAAAGQEGGDR